MEVQVKLHDLSVEDRFSQCLENILGNSIEEKKKISTELFGILLMNNMSNHQSLHR